MKNKRNTDVEIIFIFFSVIIGIMQILVDVFFNYNFMVYKSVHHTYNMSNMVFFLYTTNSAPYIIEFIKLLKYVTYVCLFLFLYIENIQITYHHTSILWRNLHSRLCMFHFACHKFLGLCKVHIHHCMYCHKDNQRILQRHYNSFWFF